MKNSSQNGALLPLLIVNPKSAGGATKADWTGMASDFRAHFGAFQVAFTKKQGDGALLAKRAAEQGRKLVIACGGDGTINEVANGILESGEGVELGILPSGTGGDFRRTLGLSNETRKAAQQLRNGESKLIDVGKATFYDHQNEQSSRYFLNIASFGLSADVIKNVKSRTKLGWIPHNQIRGKMSFALSALLEVIDLETKTVRVKMDGTDEKSLNTINFCICNARFFGGGMKIAPRAEISDGFFDVVNIGDIKTAKILLNAYTLYRGTHLSLPEVKTALAKKIEVKPPSDKEILLEIDGELPGKLPATFEIIPNSLKVRIPKILLKNESNQ